jgi:hypothetical protein
MVSSFRALGVVVLSASFAVACGSDPKPRTDGTGGDGSGGSSKGGSGGSGKGGSGGASTGGAIGSGGGGGSSGSGGASGSGGSGGASGSGGSGGSSGSGGSDGPRADGAAMDAPPAEEDAAPPVDLRPDAPPILDMNPPQPAAPWVGKDIGMMGSQMGGMVITTTVNGGQNLDFIAGGATGIGGVADSLYFTHQPLTGPGVVQARAVSLEMPDPKAAAGVMIRESLDPGAAMVFVGPIGDGVGGRVIYRKARGEEAVQVPMDGSMTGLKAANGTVLRLERDGTTVRIHAGANGNIEMDSTLVGGGTVELTLATPNAPLLYGVAVTAGNAAMPGRARFNELALHNLASNTSTTTWTHYALGTSGTSAVWTGTNPNNTHLTLTSLGQAWGGVAGTSRDFLGYTFIRPEDSTSVQFLVTSESMSDPGSRIAAMLRDVNGFSRSAAMIALSLTQGNGLELQQRSPSGEANAVMTVASRPGITPPLWLRLDRALVDKPGDPLGAKETWVTAYYAQDNNGNPRPWTQLSTPLSFPTSLTNLPALGIAVASYSTTTFHQAEVSRVRVMPAPAPVLPDGGPPDAGSADAAPADAAAAD